MQGLPYDLVGDPLGAVRSTFEKAVASGTDPMLLDGNDWGAIDLFRKFLIDESGLSQVPFLNLANIKLLQPNTLVRFRGMVQNWLGNELYIGTYKDGSVWRTNKFMDVSQSRKNTSSDVKIWERLLLYCVPVPGQKAWTEISCQKCIRWHGQWAPDQREKRRRTDDQSLKDIEMLASDDEIQASASSKREKQCSSHASQSSGILTEAAASSSALRMIPAAGSDTLPCLVKIYDSPEFGLKLNDIFEFIGVLTFDSEFQAKDDQHNELFSEIYGDSLIHLPQNKVPRLHCIIHRKLAVHDFLRNSAISKIAGQRKDNGVKSENDFPQAEEQHASHPTPPDSSQMVPPLNAIVYRPGTSFVISYKHNGHTSVSMPYFSPTQTHVSQPILRPSHMSSTSMSDVIRVDIPQSVQDRMEGVSHGDSWARSMSNNTVSSPSNSVKARWDDEKTQVLFEIFLEEIQAGNRPLGVFTKRGWTNVVAKFKVRTGLYYSKLQLKNRTECLKRQYARWKHVTTQETGLRFDHPDIISAPEECWSEIDKWDPEILKWKVSPPKYMDLMSKFFSNVATGAVASMPRYGNKSGSININVNAENNDDPRGTSIVADVGNGCSPTPTELESTPATSKFHLRKMVCGNELKGSSTDRLHNLDMSILQDRTNQSALKHISPDPTLEDFDEAMEEIKKIPGMRPGSPIWIKTMKLLAADKVNRAMFRRCLAVSPRCVYDWIDSFS